MMKSVKKSVALILVLTLVLALLGLAGCGSSGTTAAPAGGETTAPGATSAAGGSGKLDVGIVLPTKDEPRWVQDETRFTSALKEAGFSSEVLFSQGSSATEKANVEALITKGIKVLIICPQDGDAAAAAADAAAAAGSRLFLMIV
jgi:putative multiple sugar transport system substrate-binding protein